MRILILYASTHGQTRAIAQAIADRLHQHDLRVTVADLEAGQDPPALDAFDAVVLGSRVQFGRHARALRRYIEDHRQALAALPCYLFSVSNSAAGRPPGADPGGYVARLCTDLNWWPREAVAFAGALPYRDYNPITRVVMKSISRHTGAPTDTSRDHVLTDWFAVTTFADTIAAAALPGRVYAAAPRAL